MVYGKVYSWKIDMKKGYCDEIGLCVHSTLTIYGFSYEHKFRGCMWSLRALTLETFESQFWSMRWQTFVIHNCQADERIALSDPTAWRVSGVESAWNRYIYVFRALYNCESATSALHCGQLGRNSPSKDVFEENLYSQHLQRLADLNSTSDRKNAAKSVYSFRLERILCNVSHC